MKPLLIGEANPYGSDPYYALYPEPENASGGRLARILGLSAERYLEVFDRRNLCPMEWSMKVARVEARQILLADLDRPIVLLGAKVSRAFELDFLPFNRERRLYQLPHPSGLCRIWTEPNAISRARALLVDLLPKSSA